MKSICIPENDTGRLFNKQLTSRLITLHAVGYDLDFYMDSNNYLVCIQNDEWFPYEYITVKLVDQVYDFITNTYKYLHTIDTVCGKKGVMLLEDIYTLKSFRQK